MSRVGEKRRHPGYGLVRSLPTCWVGSAVLRPDAAAGPTRPQMTTPAYSGATLGRDRAHG